MVRILQRFVWGVVLVASLGSASAFVPLGPNNEAYQVPAIGYNPNINLGDALETGPKAIGEEYRRNTPVMYYSFDQNFIDYFGSNGMAAVDAAMAVLNGLNSVSSYSNDLAEIPLESMRINSYAQALNLQDLKSMALFLMMEQLGLSEPDRYTWCIHSREHFGTPPCPAGQQYLIIKRNIDPVTSSPNQFQYSSYVNGTLLTYEIVEYCGTANSPVPPMEADAREYQVDPLSPRYSAVASRAVLLGGYYTGLTRDDVGGLRYLLRAGNMNIENAGANTITFVTNNTSQLLFTSNLFDFVSAALVNDAAALTALYPNLQIASTTEIFTNVISTNVVFYFTNYPFEPFGTPPHLITASVRETNITSYYNHTFANAYITPGQQLTSNFQVPVVPGHSASNGIITTITTNISSSACGPFSPIGLICTNVSVSQSSVNGAFGDFYILPANLCDVSIVSTQLVINVTVTNETGCVIVVFTNASGGIEAVDSLFSQTPVYSYNQYVYVVRPVVCPENTVALRQGVERIQFVRRDYDSLIGQFWEPVSTNYVLNAVTNSTLLPQTVQRTVTQPDILFTAGVLTGGPGAVTINDFNRNVNFNSDNALAGLAGPGTIETPTTITFNKVGPVYANLSPGFLEGNQIAVQIWASFDGSTNIPVVYPNGTSTANLENLIFIQTSPTSGTLTNGTLGLNYTNVFPGFTVTSGATAPFVWTLSPGSAGLPAGLTLTTVPGNLGQITGRISGVPTTPGIYDFSIRMTDATARYVDRPYTITIVP